ncbi:uncharacterized protein KZ484_024715 [Pholidichthys leucotaenia]
MDTLKGDTGVANTGDMMPQTEMNSQGARRKSHHNTCKTSELVSGTGSVSGAVVQNGSSVAATRTRGSTPACWMLNDPKPWPLLNGYMNHGYEGKKAKAAPSKALKKQGNTKLNITGTSVAGGDSSAGISGGDLVSMDNRIAAAGLAHSPGQNATEPILSTPVKNQKWKKRPKCRDRDIVVAYPEKPGPSPVVPQEEEDWEREIYEATLTDWEKMYFGVKPHAPEDLLQLSLQKLTLQQMDTVNVPLKDSYSPSIHHQPPIPWSCYSIPIEPDQFADADE